MTNEELTDGQKQTANARTALTLASEKRKQRRYAAYLAASGFTVVKPERDRTPEFQVVAVELRRVRDAITRALDAMRDAGL